MSLSGCSKEEIEGHLSLALKAEPPWCRAAKRVPLLSVRKQPTLAPGMKPSQVIHLEFSI